MRPTPWTGTMCCCTTCRTTQPPPTGSSQVRAEWPAHALRLQDLLIAMSECGI